MDLSDDDEVPDRLNDTDRRPSARVSSTAAQTFAELSDDESDDEVRQPSGGMPIRSSSGAGSGNSPPDDADDNEDNESPRSPTGSVRTPDSSSPQHEDDDSRDKHKHRERIVDDDEDDHHRAFDDYNKDNEEEDRHDRNRMSSRPLDSYRRQVTVNTDKPLEADVVVFPPSVPFPSCVTTTIDEDVPPAQCPILYRLLPSALPKGMSEDELNKKEVMSDIILQKLKDCDYNPLQYSQFLESNAKLITWSDGSRSISIGKNSYQLLDDDIASKHVVFRRGDKVQTYYAGVNSISRVQPSSSNTDGQAKLVMAKAAERAANKRGAARTMLRTMDDDAEKTEKQVKLESQRRERERERFKAENRKRNMRDRQSRPNRALTVGGLESDLYADDYDDRERSYRSSRASDDYGSGGNRYNERHDTNRLLRGRTGELQVKRRRVGGSRLIDQDESDED